MTNDVATGGGDGRRPGFHDRPIRGLSVTVCILGGLCLTLGITVLAVAVTSKCIFKQDFWNYNYVLPYQTRPPPTYEVRPCQYSVTYSSPGIWSGVMYLASGIIGTLAAKRKTTCLIVSMMVLSVITTLVSVVGISFAVASNFDRQPTQVNPYPVYLIIANSVIALSGVIIFILSWIKFGYSCRALCCNGDQSCCGQRDYGDYQYHPYYSQPIVLSANSGQTSYAAQPTAYPGVAYPQVTVAPPNCTGHGVVPFNQAASGSQPVTPAPVAKA